MRRPSSPAARWWLAVLLGWTAVGLFTAGQAWASSLVRGVTPDPRWVLWAPMLSVWLWVVFTPAVWWLGGRFRVERAHLPGTLGIHLAASLGVAALDAGVDLLLLPLLLGVELPSWWAYFTSELWVNVFSYFALLAIVHAVEYRRLYHREHETAEDLSHRLARARLEALRAHLHPHFLFNAINGAAELVHESPDAADRMLTRLGDLLRRALDGAREPMVRLEEELSFAEDYLDIQRLRFGDRLDFSISVTDEALDARVPGFLLQPLLENAVRHGIEPAARGGEIRIDARTRDGELRITVTDTGVGSTLPEGSPGPAGGAPAGASGGRGLPMVRRLLAQAYGEAQELRLGPREGGGTVAEIRILRGAPPAAGREAGERRPRLAVRSAGD